MPIDTPARMVPSASTPMPHGHDIQLPAFNPLNNLQTESEIEPLPQHTLFSPLPSNDTLSETLLGTSPAICSFSHAACLSSSVDPACQTSQRLSVQDLAHSTAPRSLSSFNSAQQPSDSARFELQPASAD